MSRARDLAALAQLAGLASSTAEARLSILTRKADDLRTLLAELDTARRDRARGLTAADPAMMAGADLRWHRWIDGRRSALNGELARTLVDVARARAALKHAFGQKLASEALAERGKREGLRDRDRRAERDQLS